MLLRCEKAEWERTELTTISIAEKKQNAPRVKIVPFSQNYHQLKWKLLRINNHNGYALWNHWEWSVFGLVLRANFKGQRINLKVPRNHLNVP